MFGLVVQSARPIPGLVEAAPPGPNADLEIDFLLDGEDPRRPPEGALAFEWDGQGQGQHFKVFESPDHGLRVEYAEGIGFTIDPTCRWIEVRCPAEDAISAAAAHLLGTVAVAALRIRGMACLHGSAVAGKSGAIVFAGHGGSGKSTLAAAMMGRGYSLLHDDIVALRRQGGTFVVQPGPGTIKLWPDSYRKIYGEDGAPAELPPPQPRWLKRHAYPCDPPRESGQLPSLTAIYVSGRKDAPLRLSRLPAREALPALLAVVHPHIARRNDARRREFEWLASIAESTPVIRLECPFRWDHLGWICDRIEADQAALSGAPVSG